MNEEKAIKPLRILHLEDNRADADLVKFSLRKGKIAAEVFLVKEKLEFINALTEFNPDIILSDHSLPSFNSIEAIAIVKEMQIDIPVILITGTVSEEFAVQIMRDGAADYLLKDRLERLPIAVKAAMDNAARIKREHEYRDELCLQNSRLKNAQAVAKTGSWETNMATFDMEWSEETFNIFGLDPKEFKPTHSSFLHFVHPEDRKKVDTAFCGSMGTETTNSIEHRIITEGGEEKIVEERWYLEYDDSRNPIKAVGTCQDITERKKAETALIESEKFNKGVLSSLLSHIVVIDEHGNIIAVNKSWEDFSRENGETNLKKTGVGSNYFEVCEKALRGGDTIAAQVMKGIRSVLAGSSNEFYLEYPCHSPDEQRWFYLRIMPFGETENQLVLAHHDITERKQAEQELHTVSERLSLATRAANVGVWDLDITQDKLIWDEVMFSIFNTNPSDFCGTHKAWTETIHPDDLEKVTKDFENAIHGIEEFDNTFRILWKDNSIHYIKANALVERDADGRAVRMTGTNWDVTKEKKAEESLEFQNLELKKTNSELDKFVYSVSHDLRAPLTSMLGVIDLSLKKTNENQTVQHLNMLKHSVNKLDGFIADILDYSRNSRLEVKKEKIHLKALIDEVYDHLKYIGASNRQLTFKNNVNDKTHLYSDKSRLTVVLNNLISNAIRYQNGQNLNPFVEVQVETTDNDTKIWVIDNGIGIEKEFQSKIFDMFYRVSEASVGSGLGLYLVKEALDKLEASISLQSDIGKGSSFLVSIPNN